MLKQVFDVNLATPLILGQAAIGKFDGIQFQLVGATAGEKIVIYNPHSKPRQANTPKRLDSHLKDFVSFLHIGQRIECISCGQLDPETTNHILVVGTQSALLAYNIQANSDLFYKELADGANVLVVGQFANFTSPLVLVGGRCSVVGYDSMGNEVFWTVTSDTVSSMVLCDFDNDGEMELIVGTDDYDIRIFKGEEILAEITETDTATRLAVVEGNKFAYGLANGTIGVYSQTERLWRIKSKNKINAICAYDANIDGTKELITCWDNSKLDGRNWRNGDVINREALAEPAAGLFVADFGQDGSQQLICCTVTGQVVCYAISRQDSQRISSDLNAQQDLIRSYSMRKTILEKELLAFETSDMLTDIAIAITMTAVAAAASKPGCLDLLFEMNNTHEQSPELVILSVVIYAEGIFDGESFVVHPRPSESSRGVHVSITPPKDMALTLHAKVIAGNPCSVVNRVVDLDQRVPPFCMYILLNEAQDIEFLPRGCVSFKINERISRVVIWVNRNFLLTDELVASQSSDWNLELKFKCIRDGKYLLLRMNDQGLFDIKTDNIGLAGDVIQSMATFLNLKDLQTTADFPIELNDLQDTLKRIEDYISVQQSLVAQTADGAVNIRNLLISAEHSRISREYNAMRESYYQLMDINRDLITAQKVRKTNHDKLLADLRFVNEYIQKSARLRVGKSQSDMITACRSALKQNNSSSLIKLLKNGRP